MFARPTPVLRQAPHSTQTALVSGPLLCVSFALVIGACSSDNGKDRATIENIRLCLNPDEKGICAADTVTFSAGVTQISASADFNVKGTGGLFTTKWTRADGSQIQGEEGSGSKTTASPKEGKGQIKTDITVSDGFAAGSYTLTVSFESSASEGSASRSFVVE